MGGEHCCIGCNALHGSPHLEGCPRVTRERVLAAEPHEFYGANAMARAANGQRLLVNDEDCTTEIQYVKEYSPRTAAEYAEHVDGLNWSEAEKVAQDQLHGALNIDPREWGTRIALALTSIAAGQLALVQETRKLREHLEARP